MWWRNILLSSLNYKSLLLVGLISLTSLCYGQIEFNGGIELGAVTSQVSGDALSGYDKFGLAAGPYVRANFSETSSVRMSVLYINKGSRRNANPDNNDFRTYVLKLDYLEVPVLYNYTYESFRAELGIAAGVLINSEEIETGISRPFVQPFESAEFSIVAGLNYLFSENLFVNARFSQSIIPVRRSPSVVNIGSFYEAGQYNSVIQLMFGYEF